LRFTSGCFAKRRESRDGPSACAGDEQTFAKTSRFVSRWGMPAYTKAELDGKTVEWEMPDRTTRIGVLRVRHDSAGLGIRVECACSRTGEKETLEPRTPERKFLRKHPKPERAEFLWAEDTD